MNADDRMSDSFNALMDRANAAAKPARTTAMIGETKHSGKACSNCGTSYAKCTKMVLRKERSRACCGPCGYTDTHDDRVEPREPEIITPLAERILYAIRAYEAEREKARQADSMKVFGHPGAHSPKEAPTEEGRIAAIQAVLDEEPS